MTKRGDEFWDHLSCRLKGIVTRVNDLETRIGDGREATREGIQAAVECSEAVFRRTKDDAEAARRRMADRCGKKEAEVRKAMAGWGRNRVLEELERRAEDAEACAVWSVMVTSAAIDETELVGLRAVASRMEADAVALGEPPRQLPSERRRPRGSE